MLGLKFSAFGTLIACVGVAQKVDGADLGWSQVGADFFVIGVCVYIYIHTYIYMYTHTHWGGGGGTWEAASYIYIYIYVLSVAPKDPSETCLVHFK